MDPHGPYRPPNDAPLRFSHSGRRAVEPARILEYQREAEVDDALDYVDRYDEEIAHADAEIGRLLDGYDARFGLAQAVVLFTADHGETLLERDLWFRHGYAVYEEIIRVPLLSRALGLQPARRSEVVSGIDVATTLLHLAGVEAPVDFTGRVLTRAWDGTERAVVVESYQTGWLTVVQGQEKWIVARRGSRGGEQRYHDLAADPGERRNLDWSAHPPPEMLLERVGEDRLRYCDASKAPSAAAPTAADATAEEIETLRALGYVE